MIEKCDKDRRGGWSRGTHATAFMCSGLMSTSFAPSLLLYMGQNNEVASCGKVPPDLRQTKHRLYVLDRDDLIYAIFIGPGHAQVCKVNGRPQIRHSGGTSNEQLTTQVTKSSRLACDVGGGIDLIGLPLARSHLRLR